MPLSPRSPSNARSRRLCRAESTNSAVVHESRCRVVPPTTAQPPLQLANNPARKATSTNILAARLAYFGRSDRSTLPNERAHLNGSLALANGLEPLPTGREEAAQQAALSQFFQPRLPVLGGAAEPVENLRHVAARRRGVLTVRRSAELRVAKFMKIF